MKTMGSSGLAVWLICAVLVVGAWNEIRAEDVADFFISTQIKNADVVLLAAVEKTTRPYGTETRDFYTMIPEQMLGGTLAVTNILVVLTDVKSGEGGVPVLEKDMPYLLFLKKKDLSGEGLAGEITAYQLLGNWKGVVALSDAAKEQRAVKKLAKDSGVNAVDSGMDFVAAVNAACGGSDAPLSESALAIFKALQLSMPIPVKEK